MQMHENVSGHVFDTGQVYETGHWYDWQVSVAPPTTCASSSVDRSPSISFLSVSLRLCTGLLPSARPAVGPSPGRRRVTVAERVRRGYGGMAKSSPRPARTTPMPSVAGVGLRGPLSNPLVQDSIARVGAMLDRVG